MVGLMVFVDRAAQSMAGCSGDDVAGDEEEEDVDEGSRWATAGGGCGQFEGSAGIE